MDTVAQWEASHALKGALEAAIADLIRAMGETGRPEVAAVIFAEHLARLVEESGLPIDVAMKEGFGGKDIDTFLDALEASGFPLDGLAEMRAALGRSARRAAPTAQDPAVALAFVPAIPLPEHFEDPPESCECLAIPLPERFPAPDEAHVDIPPSAMPLPERLRDAAPATAGGVDDDSGVLEEDIRAVRNAEAHLGAPLTERERHIAARMVNQLRVRALRDRGTRFQPSPRGTLRRPRGSRAPRRAAHRTSAAPARDGPPPSEAPGPVARARAPRCAVGGVR